jgi:hypothetical protein
MHGTIGPRLRGDDSVHALIACYDRHRDGPMIVR